MEYVYTTTITVPEEAIRKIGNDLLNTVLCDIGRDVGVDDINLTDEQIERIGMKMTTALETLCKINRVSVDGYHLNSKQITDIYFELAHGRKIGAIKMFRSATDAGLREAKEFIDKFCTGGRYADYDAAVRFRTAFIG